jgi:hypothetical protein
VSSMERSWLGDEVTARINRAAGRAIIGVGMQAAVDTKRVTHVISGDLRRSVHVAPVEYEGSEDEGMVADNPSADLLMSTMPQLASPTPLGPAVEVGSWMPYACVEWVGRGHPGVTEGLESVRGMQTDRIIAAAFRQEGLI